VSRLVISGEYTPDWPAISLAIRNAEGWRCVRCCHPFDRETGRPEACDGGCDRRRCKAKVIAERWGQHNYGIHHFDGDKSNNAWWNLMALCNSCHLYVQATVIPERSFMFHHSTWMIPYVCGYYAARAGIEITRAEADANPEKWLRFGQPWLYEDAEVAS
jgi:hypothetical protein